jgi:hypothetical protein
MFFEFLKNGGGSSTPLLICKKTCDFINLAKKSTRIKKLLPKTQIKFKTMCNKKLKKGEKRDV